ncbi:unnamed protein product [Blepharisma stoltei]|uniref:Uncharacterized protein n=1 Tax=Blepharisma stoltei TaxID=1481888 RepID=A0AAU9K6Q7_9CILI|nr:unnamed protein product [Blepharisma stoltei]
METELDGAALLDENLWKIIEKKLMFINDPKQGIPVNSSSNQAYQEILSLHEHMGQAKFGTSQPWKAAPKGFKTSISDNEGFLSFQREVDIQLEEITLLLEKFQEKVENNEVEQEQLAQDIHKEEDQIEMIEQSLNETTNDFSNRQEHFGFVLKDAQGAIDEIKNLLIQGREKVTLESTVNKLEEELSRAHIVIDDLQTKEKSLSEQLSKLKTESESSIKRAKSELDALQKQHFSLKNAYDSLHTTHYQVSSQSSTEIETLKAEIGRLQRLYDALKEEQITKEEVHESLKKLLIDTSERADSLKEQLEKRDQDGERMLSKADITIASLENELVKVKSSWMQDVELLSQVRLERDTVQTQYSLLEQKFSKVLQENKALKQKVEELKQEARANFEAAKIPVTPDMNVRTATGSASRLEIEFQREIEKMKREYETEIDKLTEELVWFRAKLESEKQWGQQLADRNQKLQEQLEQVRQQI